MGGLPSNPRVHDDCLGGDFVAEERRRRRVGSAHGERRRLRGVLFQGHVHVPMGLSLGEYSALCFAGAISFADGVKVTQARGEAMQAASDAVDSGMVSVIGLSADKVKELCAAASEKSGETVQIANLLCNGNYAVSGHAKACDALADMAKPDFGARMTVKLAVAALRETLAGVEVARPRIPVISSVD